MSKNVPCHVCGQIAFRSNVSRNEKMGWNCYCSNECKSKFQTKYFGTVQEKRNQINKKRRERYAQLSVSDRETFLDRLKLGREKRRVKKEMLASSEAIGSSPLPNYHK